MNEVNQVVTFLLQACQNKDVQIAQLKEQLVAYKNAQPKSE